MLFRSVSRRYVAYTTEYIVPESWRKPLTTKVDFENLPVKLRNVDDECNSDALGQDFKTVAQSVSEEIFV